jgi:hypothetical protein
MHDQARVVEIETMQVQPKIVTLAPSPQLNTHNLTLNT